MITHPDHRPDVGEPPVDDLACLTVSYFEDDKSQLLRECLLPVAQHWNADAPGASFLERHWLRGPHVRLVVPHGIDTTDAQDSIAAWLRQHPSHTTLDATDYLRRSQELGQAELVPGPYSPLRADNTVQAEPYPVAATTALIGTVGFGLKRRFMSASTLPLSVGLEQVADGRHRIVPAFQALLAHASRWPQGGLATGQLSYRSHYEDYLAQHDTDGRLRAVIEDRFARIEPALRSVFRQQVADTTHGHYSGSDSYASAWSETFDAVWPATLKAAHSHQLTEDLGPGYLELSTKFGTESAWSFGADRPSSEFHHELAKLNYLPQRVNAEDFAAYRFLTNQVTRWLPLLGITPLERYLASYAVSELTESEYGVTWREQFAAILADPEARPSEGNRT